MSALFSEATAPAANDAPMALSDLDMPMPDAEPVVALAPVGFFAEALRELPVVPEANLTVVSEAADFSTALLALPVTDAPSCQAADNRIDLGRQILKRIEAELNPSIELAHRLHANLCEKRRQWTQPLAEAIKAVGQRVVTVQRRLEAAADEERRKLQAQADQAERERLQREADAAKAAGQTAVAEAIAEQAKTAVAAPVATPVTAPAPLKGSTARTTWKVRLTACGCETEGVCRMPEKHAVAFLGLIKAVAAGEVPPQVLKLDWTYLNQRARSDRSALKLPGLDVFEEGSLAAKPGRRS